MATNKQTTRSRKNKAWLTQIRVILVILAVLALVITLQSFRMVDLPLVPTWQSIGSKVQSLYQQVDGDAVVPTDGEVASVHFIDVGQGACTLILGEDYSMLIDAGIWAAGETVTNYLLDLGITELDYIVATHPHADHIGGIPVVLDAVDVDTVFVPEIAESVLPDTDTYQYFLEALDEEGCAVEWAVMGDYYELSEYASFTFLGPSGEFDDLNNMSAAVRFQYGDTYFDIMGDMEMEAEEALLEAGLDVTADVLALGHHGSDTSSTQEFLDAVQADYYIAQMGYGNSYGHPSEDVLDRIRALDGTLFRSDMHGDIVFVTDGENLTVYIDGELYQEDDLAA